HTLEVTQIARTIARALMLNEDLTEAIGLGHDIGHTPYGHAGERALDSLCPGGFRHYLQSVRVCEKLEKDRRGLNLTFETLNGMACHTEGPEAATLEGQVVRYADRIAFLNHDFEDSVSAGALTEEMLPALVKARLGKSKSERITTLIRSLVDNFSDGVLSMDEGTAEAFREFNDFMYETIYLNTEGEPKKEERKVYGIVESLYDYYRTNPGSMPAFYVETAFSEGADRAVTDYISGMSDEFATRTFEELFIPKSWPVS
ncbi:MAG: HD domain-containing protein, partial [Oscillospiraceae bacterium]|nr:HD domain-containing protein [Oscillospiraceae bacterium]